MSSSTFSNLDALEAGIHADIEHLSSLQEVIDSRLITLGNLLQFVQDLRGPEKGSRAARRRT